MPLSRTLLVAIPLVFLVPRVAVGQDHSMADMASMPMGLPALRPIPAGSVVTAADVQFMQGMIAHHAQAIRMSHLAAERGADPRFLRFARKIDQSQTSEIHLMQGWLAAQHQAVTDTASYHTISMPGMLTPSQMRELATLRGPAFDRRFLELMIRHHEGALGMVEALFRTRNAGQEVDVSVLANDIRTVQTAEIGVMRQMLARFEETR